MAWVDWRVRRSRTHRRCLHHRPLTWISLKFPLLYQKSMPSLYNLQFPSNFFKFQGGTRRRVSVWNGCKIPASCALMHLPGFTHIETTPTDFNNFYHNFVNSTSEVFCRLIQIQSAVPRRLTARRCSGPRGAPFQARLWSSWTTDIQ